MRRVGFAVLALGRLALDQILPAFAECRHARPVALVSGDSDKVRTVAAQYGVAPQATYDYANFDRIRDNPAVEAVYVAATACVSRPYRRRLRLQTATATPTIPAAAATTSI